MEWVRQLGWWHEPNWMEKSSSHVPKHEPALIWLFPLIAWWFSIVMWQFTMSGIHQRSFHSSTCCGWYLLTQFIWVPHSCALPWESAVALGPRASDMEKVRPFAPWQQDLSGWWCNNHLENDGVRQWEGWHPIYEMENNPFMFQTTNQLWTSFF